MNMCSLRLAFQGALEQFLRRYIITSVQFNHTTIVKRVSIARRREVRAQPGFGNREISSCAGRDFGYRRVLFDQAAKLSPGFCETAAGEFLVRRFKSSERRSLFERWLRRWRQRLLSNRGQNWFCGYP